jgi:nanoRNase/pAp phosphatase (c-di-AMP/oligoRNAs hydrolase)
MKTSSTCTRFLIALGALLLSASGQACDADEMVAQMRSACSEMIAGYQKAAGRPVATAAAQGLLAQAKVHCQALEFDKAGVKLALAARSSLPAKDVVASSR